MPSCRQEAQFQEPGNYSPPQVDRILGIWRSYYNIPKAIFCLLKGDYNLLGFRAQGFGIFAVCCGAGNARVAAARSKCITCGENVLWDVEGVST